MGAAAVEGAVDAQAVFGDVLQDLDASLDNLGPCGTQVRVRALVYHPPADPPTAPRGQRR
jgi:hypothetical protein